MLPSHALQGENMNKVHIFCKGENFLQYSKLNNSTIFELEVNYYSEQCNTISYEGRNYLYARNIHAFTRNNCCLAY